MKAYQSLFTLNAQGPLPTKRGLTECLQLANEINCWQFRWSYIIQHMPDSGNRACI